MIYAHNLELNTDELVAVLDCINNRIEDLENCIAMEGEAGADWAQDEIESLEALVAKVAGPLNGEQV
jgi:hypothetical protein